MEVKTAYKQTEVGVIPEEWDVRTLGSLTTLLTNGFVGTATTAYVEGDDGVLYIQGYNVQENGFNFHGIKRVSKAFHTRNKKSCLQTGDLLTIQTGDIGVTTVVPPELAGANCHALVISRLRKQESEAGYYCQYFNSERGRVAFKEIETGTTMKHLNGGDMKRLFLPSPPIEEQRAIAKALSDVDGLLGGLDRLIVKKRDLKQAAMQQLLTGQTRLPGFHGEWEVKRLGQLAEMGSGGTPPSSVGDYYDGDIPWASISDMTKGGKVIMSIDRNLTLEGFRNCAAQMFPAGTVLYAMYASLGECSIAGIPLCSSQAILGIRPKDGLNGDFLYYFLTSLKAKVKTWGQQGTQANLNKGMVQDFRISLPLAPEQTAIAEVLTAMDAELDALEQRREKTRALKQAMMQELLTGRTRLI
jgi:type I restriction enzyme, S subunit